VPAKVKAVIQLFMNGGPSSGGPVLPEADAHAAGGTVPSRELSFATERDKPGALMPLLFAFRKAGKAGWISRR
jgi:hypothetical protein